MAVQLPEAVPCRPVPKAEREAILGYGLEGVIVDSSAIVAILLKEPGYERLRGHLGAAEQVGIGALTVVESSLVLCTRVGHAETLLALVSYKRLRSRCWRSGGALDRRGRRLSRGLREGPPPRRSELWRLHDPCCR